MLRHCEYIIFMLSCKEAVALGLPKSAHGRCIALRTSAPRPKRKPSAKRVDMLWNTQALSILRRNCSAVSLFSVMQASALSLGIQLLHKRLA